MVKLDSIKIWFSFSANKTNRFTVVAAKMNLTYVLDIEYMEIQKNFHLQRRGRSKEIFC